MRYPLGGLLERGPVCDLLRSPGHALRLARAQHEYHWRLFSGRCPGEARCASAWARAQTGGVGAMDAIELRGLTKRYGAVVGVDELTFGIGRGEVFGFLGPNGAGKTTTLRCLTGLLRPTAGHVRVLGMDPLADHRRVAGELGYLPGELRLYPELTGRRPSTSCVPSKAGPARGEPSCASGWG